MSSRPTPVKVTCPKCGKQQYPLYQYKDGKKRDITECDKCHFSIGRRGR